MVLDWVYVNEETESWNKDKVDVSKYIPYTGMPFAYDHCYLFSSRYPPEPLSLILDMLYYTPCKSKIHFIILESSVISDEKSSVVLINLVKSTEIYSIALMA